MQVGAGNQSCSTSIWVSKRTTSRPTAEALLQVFQHIHLSVVTLGLQLHRHITPLSELQKRILALWDLSPTLLYDQLSGAFLEPT